MDLGGPIHVSDHTGFTDIPIRVLSAVSPKSALEDRLEWGVPQHTSVKQVQG